MGLCFCHCIAENDILNADGSQVSKGSEEIGGFQGQHETCGMMLQVSRETKARKKEGKGRSLQVPSRGVPQGSTSGCRVDADEDTVEAGGRWLG